MTQKKLEKKMILTVGLKGLSKSKFKNQARAMAQAQINFPAYVPGLNPAGSVVIAKINELNVLSKTRAELKAQMKANTTRINKIEDEIRDIITDLWMPQTQAAIGRDEGKAVGLGFGIKGQDTSGAHSDASVKNSIPIITNIEIHSLSHTLHIANSRNPQIIMPNDADHIDVYEWIGDDEPHDIRKMSYLGVAKAGKFVNHFEADQKDMHVWYIAVYISKKTGKPCAQSRPMKTTIV